MWHIVQPKTIALRSLAHLHHNLHKSIPRLSQYQQGPRSFWVSISSYGRDTQLTLNIGQADIQVFGLQPADGRGIFAIPYGHLSIFMSVILNMAACIIYKPLGLLICIICEIGIAANCLSAHRQKHHDVPALTAEQISVLEAYKLHESDIFEDWDNSSLIVPDISYQEGYMCTFQGCYFATVSKQHIQTHDRDSHYTRNNWKSCTVQAFYASMQRKYLVVVPHPPPVLHVPPGS